MVRTHCKKHHPGRPAPSPSQQTQLVDAHSNGGLRSSASTKYSQPPNLKPVDGLEVLQGYKCPLFTADGSLCSMAFLAHSSFERHLTTHTTFPKPDPASCASSIQTLFAQGGLQNYYPVVPSLSLPDPPPNSAYVDALRLHENLPSPHIHVAENDKERASIHWFTRWPELFEPYCKDDAQVDALRSMISFPQTGADPDWLVRVQDHGCRWWIKAESAHSKCSYRASLILKSHQMCVLSCTPRLSPDVTP